MKKLIVFLFFVTVLTVVAMFGVGAAEGNPITTADEFKGMTSGGSYYLANDIDLNAEAFKDYIFEEFSGTLDGGGFCIYNFSIVAGDADSDSGIILRANKTADLVIKNLTIGKADAPISMTSTASGKSHGLIAGANQNAFSCTLENITIYGDINIATAGKSNVGGFIGYSRSVSITDCKYYGKVQVGTGIDGLDLVYHNAAGFIGSANATGEYTVGTTQFPYLKNCENHAEITAYCSISESRAAGLVAYSGCEIHIENCKNFGKVSCFDYNGEFGYTAGDSQAAGILAHANKATAYISNCENNGDIFSTLWCSPFVAQVSNGLELTNCVNNGKYTNKVTVNGEVKADFVFGAYYAFVAEGVVPVTDKCNDFGSGVEAKVEYVVETKATTTEEVSETETDKVTEKETEKATEKVTEKVTEKDTSTKAPVTDKATETTATTPKKSCGNFSAAAAVIAVLCSVIGIAVIKKH